MHSNTNRKESESKYRNKNLKKNCREIRGNLELRNSYERNKNNGIEESD